MSKVYQITPTVDQAQEFIEIANDFSNPLDLVREALSNSFDAGASFVEVLFSVVEESGEKTLRIELKDDGHGMTRDGLQSFFDLGNSPRRGDSSKIGEKGHGTKVYLNSSRIEVNTVAEGKRLQAVVTDPFKRLHKRHIPIVEVTESDVEPDTPTQTEIVIYGYNNNRRDRFTHERLKDYVLWFTKFGSVETAFGKPNALPTLILKGLDSDDPEPIPFGHSFPNESHDLKKLFEEHVVYAPNYYCKRIVQEGSLVNHPEIRYQAVFSVEGSRVKYDYNSMLRRQGYQAPPGAYTVQERYGLWLCKDFIPVQRKNEWITSRGSEYTKFHAFFNCHDLRLTANRGSVDNTPTEILNDIREEVSRIYARVIESDDWRGLDWLESEVLAYRTTEKEKKDFDWRMEKVNRANIADLDGHVLVEPKRESGVYSLFVQLSVLRPELFPFQILDYETHEGIDVIVKGDKNTPINQAKLFYVEFKHYLTNNFNHSFANLHSIVCWDTEIKHDEVVTDINGENRKMQISQPEKDGDTTEYYLDNPRQPHKIRVYVLKDFLKAKLDLEFRPRNAASLV